MQIVTLKIDDLKPYEKNARKHQALDVAAIAESIKAFGFRDPVGIWGPNNIIVEGHGRVMAARQLGMETVPCIRLDDLTDEQRRAYALPHDGAGPALRGRNNRPLAAHDRRGGGFTK